MKNIDITCHIDCRLHCAIQPIPAIGDLKEARSAILIVSTGEKIIWDKRLFERIN